MADPNTPSRPVLTREVALLVILAGILLTSAAVAELVSVKLFQVRFYAFLGIDAMFTLTAGALLWPVVFLVTDTVNEFFGRRTVRFISWLAAGLIAWLFLVVQGAIALPAASFSPVPADTFAFVFGQSGWIIAGSVAAFLLSQLVDVSVFHAVRRASRGRFIWARATGSTVVSQLVDSFVVIYIAFWLPGFFGQKAVTWGQAGEIAFSSFFYKVGVAIALTPLIYFAHWCVERWLGRDRAHELSEQAARGL